MSRLMDEMRQEVIQEAIHEVAIRFAKKLLINGESIESVAELAELPVETIIELEKTIK